MRNHADKSLQNQRAPVVNVVPQRQANATDAAQFIDNRAETTSLRQLQIAADNRSQAQGLAQLKSIINSRPRVVEQVTEQGRLLSIQRVAMKDGEKERATMTFSPIQKQCAAQFQTESNTSSPDPTGELLSIIAQLEQLVSEAKAVEDDNEPANGIEALSEKIVGLKVIANGKDQQKKSEALHALKIEIPDGQVSAIKEKPIRDTKQSEPSVETSTQVSQQKTVQPVQRVVGLIAGLAIGGTILGIAAIAGGVVWYVRRRRRQQQQAIFEEFGNAHRNPNFDPDIIGQNQGGIHVAVGAAARPEDAPSVNYFRTRFHKLHSAKLYLEQRHPQLIAGFTAHQAAALNNLSLRDRLIEISAAVKEESKAHKKRVKDLATNTDVAALDAQYTVTISALGDDALTLANHIRTYIDANSTDDSNLDQIHTVGTDMWRTAWLRAIQVVNTVLHGRWPHWRGQITNFIRDKHDNDHLDYMDPNQVIGLDYIGSLARGYKGPPKQAVRFMPEKFDVDANLTAPPLAAYALAVGNAIVDRGRIWSQHAGPAIFNGLLQPMQVDIQQRLVNAGLIQMGMDPNEPFEVVIDSEGVETLPNVPAAAVASKALSERDLVIRNRLHALRSTDRDRFQRVGTALQLAGFTHTANLQELLNEHDDDNQTYAFTDAELTTIDGIITNTA